MPVLKFDPSVLYYVIIGCGFSAITNHTILEQTSARLGKRTVLHIGGPDPWADYHPMPMGQWPSLLNLPGFETQPTATAYECLGSAEFARVNQAEWDRLAVARPFAHLNAWVKSIRKVGTPPHYELLLHGAAKTVVLASHIDICGGPGPSRELPENVLFDADLVDEYESGNHLPGLFPRLISADKFLSQTGGPVVSGRSVCVVGGGPTSAWCVERAESFGNRVLWLANEKLNAAFVSSRRNDGLVAGVVKRKLVEGEHTIEGRLKPRRGTTIFAEGYAAKRIRIRSDNRVDVWFEPIACSRPRYVSFRGRMTVPKGRPVDQVIYSIGQATHIEEETSWAHMLQPILSDAISKKVHWIRDRFKRVVGLQSSDGLVRVLGAAALEHPTMKAEWVTPGTRSNLFFRSLTEQAQVRCGITLAALTIAEANGYWFMSTNDNLNTAGLGDLKELMSSWDDALKGPATWFEMRGIRIPPLDRSEFGSLLNVKTRY